MQNSSNSDLLDSPARELAQIAERAEPRSPSTLLLLLFSTLAALVFWLLHRGHVADLWLEDLPVYTRAIHSWLTQTNPYNADLSPLYFLYPPVFLWMASLVSPLFPHHAGAFVYAVTHMAATCALPLVLARFYFRRRWMGPIFALLLFFASPRFTGVLAFCGMNIASTLYLLALIAGIAGIRRNRWGWFYLAVIFAASIKISFLALLLLPLLAGRRQGWRSAGCAAAVIAVNLAEQAIWPSLYAGYQWSLHQGILVNQSYGYGLFGILASYHHTRNPQVGLGPYLVAALFSLGLVIAMFVLRRRLEQVGEAIGNPIWLALVLVTIILVNPRQMQYDVDIALFAGYLLCVYGLRVKRLLVLMVLLFMPSLLIPYVVMNPHLHGVYETCLAVIEFGFGYGRLWREAGAGWAGVSAMIEEPV